MSIKERIVEDMKSAMKARDGERVGVLRMLKARMLDAEVAQRAEKGVDYQLDDEQAVQVLSSYAKQRTDSIESYREAGREDLAAKEEAELAVIREYLPRQLGEDELRGIVAEAIAEVGASSVKDMGGVMKVVMPKVKGAADGRVVNRIVRELLGG